ncbi:glycoside hydrolase family 3 N-terminal domain-containing protein [Bacteroides sp. 51]|uniref:glycoside hydrolase family 3 N-terminal domain-containing protein n=1 Tax=Bacteroides sp. 51 TaxID=2302938 RepID=UPI001EF1E844|nr:glycoside hydrolase family 3 N-terminal domain-containing protein [Bacteroides sp. 51]
MVATIISCKAGGGDYTNPALPISQRVSNLMSQMTLEEKVAQMCQYVGLDHMKTAEKDMSLEDMKKSHAQGFYPDLHSSDVEEMTKKGMISSFLHVVTAEEANYLQSLAMQSRLKIPLLIGIDAIHGNGLYCGSTIYPTPIGQASSFDPALVKQLSRETAIEMRASGMHWTFTPNVEVARDARWGRVGETFGEDPYLVGLMGAATVAGFQTDDFTGEDKVIACVKHLVGGSQPENGINGAPAELSERTLKEVFFPPFKDCVDAGAFTVMTAHNELNGIPCHGSKYLMTDLLRDQWSFDGFVVSDWMDIERMHDYHTTVETLKDAYRISVDAGMGMHMHGPEFYEAILECIKEGSIKEKQIDEAVSKILEAKFRLGLFENPYVDMEKKDIIVANSRHQKTALEAARKSIVLLKNENNLLPLDAAKYKKVFVTGHNADNQSILGDWALEQPEENVTTVLEGLKAANPETAYSFLDLGWNVRELKTEQIKEAVQRARTSDLAILVVGENSMRYHWTEKTCGENSDRYELTLPGRQQELVEAVAATGVPTIVILVNGRPLSTEWIAENMPCLIEAWEPGMAGGQAIAEILYGKVNPSGKLPITIPRSVGQIRCMYNHKSTNNWFPYATGNSKPLYEFGYGLSYTTYQYANLQLSEAETTTTGNVQATIEVTNTGEMDGEEIVQLYIRDEYSSATRPVKELKAFERVSLKSGESKRITFTVTPEMLSYYDAEMKYGVEKGTFKIMVGPSSKDEDLQTVVLTVK